MLARPTAKHLLVCQIVHMQINSHEIRQTNRNNRTWSAAHRNENLAQISQGCHLPQERLDNSSKPWEARNLTAEARVLATTLTPRRKGEIAFTAESALVVLGLEPWWNNPDVRFRRDGSRRSPAPMPPVKVGDWTVPGVRVVELRSAPSDFRISRAFDVDIVEPHLVAADLCRYGHPLQAFHDVSILLRHLAQFDRADSENSRAREELWRTEFLSYLEKIGSNKGLRRGRAIISAADAALESPAESIVAWTLNCILDKPHELQTQFPAAAKGKTVYMDLALPSYRLAIEVTGYGKFGETESTAREIGSKLVARQQSLSETGWHIINITYEEAKDVVGLAHRLRGLLALSKIETHAPKGDLWATPTRELFSKDRRF